MTMPKTRPTDLPTLHEGDEGPAVMYMQALLPHSGNDGDFGPITLQEVQDFQRTRGLPVTGVVNDETWDALEAGAPPVMPNIPSSDAAVIMMISARSEVAGYNWRDRGQAPLGFMYGIGLSFAQSYLRLKQLHPAVVAMVVANKHDDDIDAISWFNSNYDAIGIRNEVPGVNVLISLYMMLLGLGMRESSGQHCCGRDQSASNTTSETCEAGLYQTSYNAHVCHDTFDPLMDEFAAGQTVSGFQNAFAVEVSCSSSDWDNYGSGRGEEFQMLCKSQPAFAVESCGLVLRNLRQHYGPVNRKELELRLEAQILFEDIKAYIDESVPTA